MSDPARVRVEFDTRVQDPTILEEIDLYSELIIVAAASSETLMPLAEDKAPRSARWARCSSTC